MPRSCPVAMDNIVWFLTGNAGKVEEAAHHFAPFGYEVRQLKLDGGDVVEPQASDLHAVALAKIEQAKHHAPTPSSMLLVEDAGLFVDALNGFPGVYSSYVYETVGCLGVLRLLSHLQSEDPVQAKRLRSASFKAVAVMWDGKDIVTGVGACPGSIAEEVRGDAGFGYDPVFVPADLDAAGNACSPGEMGELSTHGKTFGEVDVATKHRFSHRRRALDDLLTQLPNRSEQA